MLSGCYVVSLIITQVVRPLGLLLLVLLVLGALIPTLACGVRRLHDTGKSGAFILFGLIPFVGGIILLVFFVMDSSPATTSTARTPRASVALRWAATASRRWDTRSPQWSKPGATA